MPGIKARSHIIQHNETRCAGMFHGGREENRNRQRIAVAFRQQRPRGQPVLSVKIAELDVKVFPVVRAAQVGNHVPNLHDLAEHGLVLHVNPLDSRLRQSRFRIGEDRRRLREERLPSLSNIEARLLHGYFPLVVLVELQRVLELSPVFDLLSKLDQRGWQFPFKRLFAIFRHPERLADFSGEIGSPLHRASQIVLGHVA